MTGPTETHAAEQPGSIGWFIERFGLMNEEEGMPRTAGRMFALMLTESGPISFSNLASRLDFSRGSVSINSRLLEEFGMVERVSGRGERQDYFQVVDNPWERVIDRRIAQQRRACDYVDTLFAAQRVRRTERHQSRGRSIADPAAPGTPARGDGRVELRTGRRSTRHIDRRAQSRVARARASLDATLHAPPRLPVDAPPARRKSEAVDDGGADAGTAKARAAWAAAKAAGLPLVIG